MKPKKSMRSFRCPDTLWSLVKAASKNAEMSTNEWVLSAIRSQLKEGVQGEGGVDIEDAKELAAAQAINNYSQSQMKAADILASAIERTDKIFALSTKKLEESLTAYADKTKKQ